MNLSSSLAAAAVALAIASPTFAAGSDSSEPPKPTETTQKCKKHKIWDEAKGKCVKIQKSELSDDGIYKNARELAYAGRYEGALELLDLAANQQDPRILNYKGFTNRKLGYTKRAVEFYEQALAIDPKYILARSYFGQAKMQVGDIAGAKEQLALIEDISGTDNWAYESLSRAIQGDTTLNY